MRFRYRRCDRWLKGNLHTHTTKSDGKVEPAEAVRRYAEAGYDFLALTDHWAPSDVDRELPGSPIILLDGVELDGKDHLDSYYHVVCLGRFEEIRRDDGFETALESCRRQGGLLILAHPYWTGNTLDEAARHRFDGVEIYNNVCRMLNAKGLATFVYESLREARPDMLGFAVDDAHFNPAYGEPFGGWIRVAAREATRASIIDAIRRGEFYSSTGPSINRIELEGKRLEIETSPVSEAWLVGPRSRGVRLSTGLTKPITTI
jgi:hypothetical protein